MSDVSHVALATGTLTGGRIQTSAKAFGTFVSPTTGEILYVDPKHEDERHHSPKLTPAEAKEAHMRGFIEDYDTEQDAVKNAVNDGVLPIDDNDIRVRGPERTEKFAAADAEGGPGSGTLDSRSSTAWEDRERVEGGAQGSVSPTSAAPLGDGAGSAPGQGEDGEAEDADAPPAPKPQRKPAAAKTPTTNS